MIKHKRGYSAPPFEVDEAVCEQLCQHPSCWRSTRRLMRGLPRKLVRVEKQDTSGGTSDNEDQELPTQKVCNILDEFGSDPNDRFPSDYKGMPQAYRMDLRKPSDLKPPRRPMVTPATSFEQEVSKPQLRSVEVQELFEMGDLAGTYVDTFVDKPFLVWVPNQRKLAEKEKKKEKMMQDLKDKILQRAQQAGPKDVTEELVPREIEEQREREILFDNVWPRLKQKQILKSSGGKSPTNKQQPYKFTPPRTPRQVPFDTRLFEVFNCSSDVMLRILEHIEKYDLNSKEQIFELLQRLAPENLTPKSKAELALIGNEIMTHQKGPPSERGLAWKSPAAVNNAPPVFYLDEVPTEKSLNSPVYPRYRNPLPAINSGEDYGMKVLKKKVVSLGLPELPPGVSPTRPFRYGKPAENFALEAHSVPSRVGSSHSGYSTSTRGGSPDNMREDTLEQIYVKQYRKNLEKGVPLHAISPADSTKVPHTPLSTPVVKTPTAHASERHGEIQVPKKFQLTQDAFTDAFAAAKSPQVYREKSGMAPIEEREENKAMPIHSPSKPPNPKGLIITSPLAKPKPSSERASEASPNLQLPHSRKSVRFAPGVKRSSPNSEVVVTPTSTPPTSANKNGVSKAASSGGSVDANVDRSPRSDIDAIPIKIPTVPNTPDVVEVWPLVNEADYDVTPEPRPIRILGSGYDHPDSKLANFDSKSLKSSTPSHHRSDDSRESLRSEMNRKRFTEESPGPPPPSPDPVKDTEFDDFQNGGDVRREFSTVSNATTIMTPLMEEDSDGEMTISADPPSRVMSSESLRLESGRTNAKEKMLNNVKKMDEIIDTFEELDEAGNRQSIQSVQSRILDEDTMREIEQSIIEEDTKIVLSAEPPEKLFSHEVSPVPSMVDGEDGRLLATKVNNNEISGGNDEKDAAIENLASTAVSPPVGINGNLTDLVASAIQDALKSDEDEVGNSGAAERTVTPVAQEEAEKDDAPSGEDILAVSGSETGEVHGDGEMKGKMVEAAEDTENKGTLESQLKTKLEMLDMGCEEDEDGFKDELRDELRKIEES